MPFSPSSRPAIPWHARLEARVLVGVVLIGAVSLAAVFIATRQVITHNSLARATDDLVAARAAFERLVGARRQAAAKATRLIVELPVFRASLASADRATIDQMAGEYCEKLGAHFCVVSDASGAWLGHAGPVAKGWSPALTHVLDGTRAGGSASAILTLDDGLFLVVAEPAMFSKEVIGAFTAGYRLDDGVAAELALITNSEVSFVCGGVCGSSLSASARQDLQTILVQRRQELGEVNAAPALRTIGGQSYVGGLYALEVSADERAALVLLKDWAPTALALREITTTLSWVTVLTLGAGIGGTLLFGRRLTRPLRDLATVAGEIASGQWSGHVPSRGPIETRRMADAFNHMTTVLSHWHEQVQARTAELSVAYQRFRGITDSASDAIVSVDAEGRIVFWNPAAERIFGYREADAVGRPLAMLVPEEARADYATAFADLTKTPDEGPRTTVECTALRQDGARIPLELSLSSWASGANRLYTGIVRDMTERQQTAEALRQREEQLRQAQKMEAVGRLAGGVAHDFNNLLTAILGYTDLLLDQLPANDPVRKSLAEIQKAGRHAAALTRDLLAFSRKQVLQPVVIDLNEVIRHTDSLLRRLVGEHVEIALDLTSDLPHLKADPSQISQVLLNLGVNARDAMVDGGRLTISTSGLTASRAGDKPEVLLTVRDTGSGMTDDVRAHIFEPFFTTKGVGRGTGLGLSTVYGIVQQSGGRIWVESEPTKGSAFFVAFPVVDAPLSAESATEEPALRPIALGETVLVVEDNEGVRAMVRETLAGDGYHVMEAPNGAEALALIGDQIDELDLVLTDVVMPVMGGRELVTRLRARRPDLRIVFTSGYASDPNTALHARAFGAGFIQKPFVPSALRRVIRETLETAIPA